MKKLIALGLVAAGSIVTFEILRRKGVIAQIGGKVKDVVGAITDDPGLRMEGMFDSAKGKVMEVTSKTKDAFHKAFDKAQEEVEEEVS
jgi:uncharacterized protein YjbJ (UPF0337 family)